ncbi:MAG: bifunctional UDP-3-O-[3-hydroxymyristoyl] N-acetylglucosamine deacetylase/3-hydroxyacyl-ACP dehydratase [Candidatus Neomarinimicrobiota bacterium]
MSKFQRTISKPVSIVGKGLHTGVECTITFKPADSNTGIRFVRTDVEGCPEIKADIDHVVDISRGTTIRQNGVKVHTVEHVLAAVTGLRIDNILIELTEKEPPVIDGSAKEFVDALLTAGIVEQNARREVLEIDRTITYSDPERGIDIHVLPSDRFRVTFMIDYKIKTLGTQYTAIYNMEKDFADQIAPARTFCFLSEVEELKDKGLIKGGALDNAVVIIDKEINRKEVDRLRNTFGIEEDIILGANGVLNGKKLRFVNEPVRHKALDLIGDLALLGIPIRGHVIAARSGHASNVELVKKIKKEYEKKILQKRFQARVANEYLFDIQGVLNVLPHRFPFILVDRIVDMVPGERVQAVKNVTVNEPFFPGHFPHQPVMPGVIIIEAMAQAGAFLILHSLDNPNKKNMYITGIEQARFRATVIPGDQLRIEMELQKFRLGTAKLVGRSYVGDKLVAEAILTARVVDRREN